MMAARGEDLRLCPPILSGVQKSQSIFMLSVLEEVHEMYSRRAVLIRTLSFIPFLFAPTRGLNSISKELFNKRSGKIIKGGWMLQEGDI
jgi:hypothetical protein